MPSQKGTKIPWPCSTKGWPWAEIVKSVKTGDIDAVQGMFYSADRDRILDFSSPYLISYYVSVVQEGNGPPPETIADLAGKQLVVQDGDVILDFLAKESLTAARRSADITKQLLAFARKQTINPRVLDLNETVESMLKMLQRLIGEDIHLSWMPV